MFWRKTNYREKLPHLPNIEEKCSQSKEEGEGSYGAWSGWHHDGMLWGWYGMVWGWYTIIFWYWLLPRSMPRLYSSEIEVLLSSSGRRWRRIPTFWKLSIYITLRQRKLKIENLLLLVHACLQGQSNSFSSSEKVEWFCFQCLIVATCSAHSRIWFLWFPHVTWVVD